MRIMLVLLATTALAACGEGGAGVSSASSSGGTTGSPASPTPSSGIDFTQLKTPTVAKTYIGIGGEQVFSYKTGYTPDPDSTFPATNPSPTAPLTSVPAATQTGQTYAGNTSSIRNSSISISYDPTAATYTLSVADGATGAAANTKFQDPASLISFSGTGNPQFGTPNITTPSGFQYYQAGDGNPLSPYLASGTGTLYAGNSVVPAYVASGATASYVSNSLFVQTPGTSTQYVTLAGYVRNSLSFAPSAGTDVITYHLERGAFAYGINTDANSVPTTGTATYNGSLLASMVYNTAPSIGGGNPTYYQWIIGTAQTTVDFGKSTVGLALNGTVSGPQVDFSTRYTPAQVAEASLSYHPTVANPTPVPIVLFDGTGTAYSTAQVDAAAAKGLTLQSPLPSTYKLDIPGGSTFAAAGTASISLATTGGFSGSVSTATLTAPNTTDPITGAVTPGAVTTINPIAGSTITGAFYGPKAAEVGGGFRVVGGVPNQRVDIVGAFTGK